MLPLALTDRPLVTPPGVTELEGWVAYYSYVDPKTMERTGTGTPGLEIEHAFGPVEVGLGIAQLIYGWLAVDTHIIPQRIAIQVAFSAFEPDARYSRNQILSVGHKVIVTPRKFAIVAFAELGALQFGRVTAGNQLEESQAILASAGLALEAQIDERIALSFAIGANGPLAQSANADQYAAFAAAVGLVMALDTWELFLSGGVSKLPRPPTVGGRFGIKKRWGLYAD